MNHDPRGAMNDTDYGGPEFGIRKDYRRAHKDAGDRDYQTSIPETCYQCWYQDTAREELGLPAQTRADQAITPDEERTIDGT